MNLFGRMSQMGGAPLNPATFVAARTYAGPPNPQSVTWPTGTQAGDLAIICGASFSASPTGLGGWNLRTDVAGGINHFLAWKVLDAGDIAAPPTVGNEGADGTLSVHAFRGPASVSVKEFATSAAGASTVPFAAFTPSTKSMGTFSWVADRDIASVPVPPADWAAATAAHAGANWMSRSAYNLLSDGRAATWTGFTTGALQFGYMAELSS